MLFLAWRYGGEDPYRLYNMLDEQYRPIGEVDEDGQPAAPRPPLYPSRVKAFLYACATYAEEHAALLAGAEPKKPPRKPKSKPTPPRAATA